LRRRTTVKPTSLSRRSLTSEVRVVIAGVLVDLKQMRVYLLNFIGTLFVPLLFLVTFYLTVTSLTGGDLSRFHEMTGSYDILAYMLVGYVFTSYVNDALFSIGENLKGMMIYGVFESISMVPISRVTFLMMQTLSSYVWTTIYTSMILGSVWLLFGFVLQGNLPLAAVVVILSVVALYGFGFFYAGFTIQLKGTYKLSYLIGFIFPILCGFSYSVVVLPTQIQLISKLIPLTYSIDMLRFSILATIPLIPTEVELMFLALSALVFPYLGYRTYLKLEARARREGTLGRY